MITKMSMKNFKPWKTADEIPLSPITAIFGSNSSGKTSFLQLLLMLKQTVESRDRAEVLTFGDERSLVQLGSFKDIIFQHNKTSPLIFGISWQWEKTLKILDPQFKKKIFLEGNKMEFQAEIRETESNGLEVNHLKYTFDSNDFIMKQKVSAKNQYDLEVNHLEDNCNNLPKHRFSFKRIHGRAWSLPAPIKCYGFPDQVKAYFQNAGFLSNFELELETLFNRVYYLGPLRDHPKREYTWSGTQPTDVGQRGEKVIEALLASRERGVTIPRGRRQKKFTVEEYVAYWLKTLNLIYDFSVQRISKESNLYQVFVQKRKESAKVLITDVGFGVSQILAVLTICYYVPEGSTILMEQPEIHLHPAVQSGLADVFIDAMQKRKIQIILESHSEHLLKRLQRRIAEKKMTDEELKLYFCEMQENGSSKLIHLDRDSVGNITNWPKDFFGDRFGEMAAITEAQMNRRKKESA